MRELIDQVEHSLDQPLFFLSLLAGLAIPDIAGALDAEDGLANGIRYAAWYDRWVRPCYGEVVRARLPVDLAQTIPIEDSPLTGKDCYLFRCSLLHQGSTQHPNSRFSRIIFLEPGTSTTTLHYNIVNDALNIDVSCFCREVVAGAQKWLASAESTSRYQINHDRFARRYPNGLHPYIVGTPVVT